MRLQNITVPAGPHVVDDVEVEFPQSSFGRRRPGKPRTMRRNSVLDDRLQQIVCETGGDDVDFIAASEQIVAELRRPLLDATAPRIVVIQNQADSHPCLCPNGEDLTHCFWQVSNPGYRPGMRKAARSLTRWALCRLAPVRQ